MTRQDSSFYTNGAGPEVVWEDSDNPFFVMRNGEMRIQYKDATLRYTSDLLEAGIDSDQKLIELDEAGEIEWMNNSWYEVWSDSDPDYFSEPLHELDLAIETAKELRHAE